MIGLMGLLTSIISWIICVFAVISSVAITVVLWITYYDIRKTEDAKIKYTQFEEFLRNETVIYATAIIATVIMVIVDFRTNFMTSIFLFAFCCMYAIKPYAINPISFPHFVVHTFCFVFSLDCYNHSNLFTTKKIERFSSAI